MDAKTILKNFSDKGMLDSLDRWNTAIDTIKAVPGNLGDLEVLKYTEALVEKVYAYAKGE